jgi:molybdopterin synthase sulfur carrier subunit
MPAVFIPTALRRLSGGVARIDVPAGTVADVIAALDRRFPGMREALIEDEALRPGVIASIDGEQTSWLLTQVPEGAELHFVLAISGG